MSPNKVVNQNPSLSLKQTNGQTTNLSLFYSTSSYVTKWSWARGLSVAAKRICNNISCLFLAFLCIYIFIWRHHQPHSHLILSLFIYLFYFSTKYGTADRWRFNFENHKGYNKDFISQILHHHRNFVNLYYFSLMKFKYMITLIDFDTML